MKLLSDILVAIGTWSQEKHSKKSKYKPKFNGQWVNVGTDLDEEWVWKEKVVPMERYFVNVYEVSEGVYEARVSSSEDPSSVQTIKCGEYDYVEVAVRWLSRYYNTIGEFRYVEGVKI